MVVEWREDREFLKVHMNVVVLNVEFYWIIRIRNLSFRFVKIYTFVKNWKYFDKWMYNSLKIFVNDFKFAFKKWKKEWNVFV